MRYKLKNILFSSLLGITLLTNAINFHAFTHLFDSGESDSVECKSCLFIAQQEDSFHFTFPATYLLPDNNIKHNVSNSYTDITSIVKKTIITDYFFNKPPPISFYS